MKPQLQKLPVSEQSSFFVKTFTTPLFETSWHQHYEFELILLLKGKGRCFIGNYMGDFKEGDIFFLGSNLPHEFKKQDEQMECSMMIVHFDKDFWGQAFWLMPECKEIIELLDQSKFAIKLDSNSHPELALTLKKLENAAGFERVTLLCWCLLLISREKKKQTLSTLHLRELSLVTDDKINAVINYTITHFKHQIELKTIAHITHLSVPAFCRYFKRKTKKTYVEFLNETRIDYACKALLETDKSILEICYACGFNTISNFNKQFLKIKNVKPSLFKKNFKYKVA